MASDPRPRNATAGYRIDGGQSAGMKWFCKLGDCRTMSLTMRTDFRAIHSLRHRPPLQIIGGRWLEFSDDHVAAQPVNETVGLQNDRHPVVHFGDQLIRPPLVPSKLSGRASAGSKIYSTSSRPHFQRCRRAARASHMALVELLDASERPLTRQKRLAVLVGRDAASVSNAQFCDRYHGPLGA